MNVTTLGIDLAKQVFYLHGEDGHGHVVLRDKVIRARLRAYIANLPQCTIAMEACGGAHYWARQFSVHGHRVRLISPKYVKAFVKTNKNDWNDAAAICEAAQRPTMRFVAVKSVAQQEILALHRVRERLIKQRTALANQIRGLLQEYGIVIAYSLGALRRALPSILEDAANELTPRLRELLSGLYVELDMLDTRIKPLDIQLAAVARQDPACQRLLSIPGVGPLTATALMATIGDPSVFKNGRHLAAFLGLVPRQATTGGKTRLLSISKRGDRYLRTLLIHGGRAVVARVTTKTDQRSRWIQELVQRRGKQCAMVAVANKNARCAWALLNSEQDYRVAA